MTGQLDLFEPPEQTLNYGWMGTIAQFLATNDSDWLDTLSTHYQQLYRQRSTGTQQQAWLDCATVLRSQFVQLTQYRSDSAEWTLIFEYELPREGGRRPDLVLLAAGQILVFEFKQKPTPSAADLDQVAAYARDLSEYHAASAQQPITAIVVPTRRTTYSEVRDGVQVLSPHAIADYLSKLESELPAIDPQIWVNADYAPLPTIVQAARRIFQQEPLPDLKRARSAGIPDVLAYLDRLVERAQAAQERHLVLITGVPGAGKTLIGLQFVHQTPQDLSDQAAVFLSGNGPLITVLQYALKSRVFVQAVRNFYIDHEVRRQKAPREHLIVFDEAQRAWDADRMAEKYGINSAAAGAVVRIAERSPDWCVLLGLIGEGQEIHVGEEDGTEQWNVGLEQASADWHVHCSPEQASYFTAVSGDRLHTNDVFNLTTSLRTHLAKDVQTWVAHVLLGEFDAAAMLMPSLLAAGYDPYLTRDLEQAMAYCRDRYQDQPDKRYGLLASSRAHNLSQHGIANEYMATQRVKMGPWYIDPPNSPLSCCALDSVVTEFGCQGLELDYPIVGWGDDLLWRSTWMTRSRQKNVRDPLRLRLNSYRVLLTRGRDGFVVFVPPDATMDTTFEALQSAGLRSL
ncbi:DUF2075 domain-containing protein [Leptolyngbya sp. FACHB-36]|uniref:DNA/RNA helicase domain-containing protein n=1 Tax=Leptolyngbya sp. FACHB-36 TaxID=2692808 RepID=UPI001681BC02|nr:DNA/RNA helicase domain-containing protein [Leptolyngbya sp. FACHB-36]MBD2020161.1 DUF2075 domain-containing protein [Leptolyngbya sp. FACHB-36]